MSTRSPDETLALLTAELDASRELMAAHRFGMKRAASPGDQLKRSLRDHKGLFFGSAVALGLLLALLPSTEKKSKKKLQHRKNIGAQVPEDTGNVEEGINNNHPILIAVGVTVTKMIWDAAKTSLLKWLKENALRVSRNNSSRPSLGETQE